ncbi:acyl-CoA dehydrogenase family protein [Pseudomonas sp. S3E17]|uniref:acyl-CoA dehydrogenase family protein n=1 Tax=Pseudomonas sp. S3E17 TaxID=2817893 RepID=UPI0020A01207|nr:acyl-CoA dehydrogenase family protein [Pseudomonas sp. S3E17]MCP1465529.1 alkylation response protein AidB-like acyl-CoA dehydrogenase [Pseudomonas sp. S3E17]
MPSPYLSDSHRNFALQVRQILQSQLLPIADAAEERGHLCENAWQTLAEHGLLGLPQRGEGFLESAVFLEELGALGYAGIRASVGVHAYMASAYLELFGSEEQIQRYLPGIRQGRIITALAISEEHAGSDLSQMQCRARPSANGFIVEGSKRYIANGSRASLIVTLVRSCEGQHALSSSSLLLIDGDSPGLVRTPHPMLGWCSADVCDLDFTHLVVPACNVLGKSGKGLLYLMQGLDFERLVAGLLALGGAHHSIRVLDGFVRRHQLQGRPLSDKQSVRHRLADLVGEQQILRHYAYQVAWQHSKGQLDTRSACILKLRATELALSAAQACAQLHGAQGYQLNSEVARVYRDAMAGTIAAGASELMRDMIFDSTPAS